MDFFCLAVAEDYRGNKIANYLIKAALELIQGKGYSFANIEAFNYWTMKAAERNGFEAVYSVNAKDFLWKGERLYSAVEEPHENLTRLMKKL